MKILFMVFALFTLFSKKENDIVIEAIPENVTVQNREITLSENPDFKAIKLDARKYDGLAIFNDVEFDEGDVIINIKGEDVQGKSFVGFAFNIKNDSTYEVIYFRPFNFNASEQIRREHMVQYVHHPKYTWYYLRNNFTGIFEKGIPDPPNPNNWFKAKINISEDSVKVYMPGLSNYVLAVERLCDQESNKIGYWTGFGSGGEFGELRIIKN